MSQFNKVQMNRPKSNTFDLNHDHKFSAEMGRLIPNFVQEVLPGDRFSISTQTLIRFAPLIAPVMHNIRCFQHYFFVPNRIVWDGWEEFISPQLNKEQPPAWPYVNDQDNENFIPIGSVGDYMGLPTNVDCGNISAMPLAAYNKIYNEYYRDQNLIDPVPDELIDGDNTENGFSYAIDCHKRAWQHDYFTSALPFAQKGPAVNLPLSGDAPIYHNIQGETGYAGITTTVGELDIPSGVPAEFPTLPNTLHADLSDVNATTINDLRVAFRLQEWFEKAARGGSRYVEQLKVHWGVTSSDQRLQRPEFLGGSRVPVVISEVLQTSESGETTPQGTMAGHALSADSGKKVRYRAEEYGYIIGIMSIMPSTAYYQGIPRHFSRQSWEDYAFPTFAHLGEQAILNKELYADGTSADNDTFGYIPRYSEYRYTPSRVSGDFRESLLFWHMARKFDNRPLLNKQFIEANPATRIFAVETDEDDKVLQHLWCHSFHKVRANRLLPKYGTPTL